MNTITHMKNSDFTHEHLKSSGLSIFDKPVVREDNGNRVSRESLLVKGTTLCLKNSFDPFVVAATNSGTFHLVEQGPLTTWHPICVGYIFQTETAGHRECVYQKTNIETKRERETKWKLLGTWCEKEKRGGIVGHGFVTPVWCQYRRHFDVFHVDFTPPFNARWWLSGLYSFCNPLGAMGRLSLMKCFQDPIWLMNLAFGYVWIYWPLFVSI